MRDREPTRDELDERIRILRAIKEGRMSVNEHGRYVIEGEARPDRKQREALWHGMYFDCHWDGGHFYLYPKGEKMLDNGMEWR